MNAEINELLDKLETGEPVSYENITVYPLFNAVKSNVKYAFPEELIKESFLEITEIDQGGSVPELMVINRSEKKVFFWDGMELIGAKQNRVLNVSLLIDKHSESRIPVSCVEQSRWSYKTKNLHMSDFAMPNQMRWNKNKSVEFSMRSGVGARSDQRAVWDDVENYSIAAKIDSPTNAMNDVLHKMSSKLDDFSSNLPISKGQKGIMVAVNGKIIGFEYISSEEVFKELYPKMIKSFASDSLVRNNREGRGESKGFQNPQELLSQIRDLKIEKYKSVGLGSDLRFAKEFLSGSGILYRKNVIAFSVGVIN